MLRLAVLRLGAATVYDAYGWREPDSIDDAELERWAPRLGVADLLAAARREARE